MASESARSRPGPITWTSWINVALGVWLVVAAFLFPHSTGSGVTEDVSSSFCANLISETLWPTWSPWLDGL